MTSSGEKHLQRGLSGVSRSVNVPVAGSTSRRVANSRSVPGQTAEEANRQAEQFSHQRHADAGLLDSLGGGTLCEIENLNSPDPVIVGVLGNVHCLLGLKDDWESVRASILAGSDLLERMRSFDQSSVTQERLESLRRRQLAYPDSVVPAKVAQVSEACAVLCVWVNSVCHRAGHTFQDDAQHRLEQIEHENQLLEAEAQKECQMTDVPQHAPGAPAGHPVLYLRVLAAYQLKNRDSGLFGDVSDPFVVAKVGSVEQKTPAIQNNLNPVWEGMEGCEFAFTLEGEARTLELEVFNENHFKSHATLGRARFDVEALPPGEWRRQREPLEDGDKGQIEFDVLLDISGPQDPSVNAN